jgi:hypothetical protein
MARFYQWLCALIMIITVLSILKVVEGGNCTNQAAFPVIRDRFAADIHGERISVYPSRNRIPDKDFELRWHFALLVERAKVNTTVDGRLTAPEFVSPGSQISNPLTSDVDPLQPYEPHTLCGESAEYPCGPILRVIELKEMNCFYSEASEENFEGKTRRDSVYVTFTHDLYPDFRFVAGHHIVNDPVTVPANNDGDQYPGVYMCVPSLPFRPLLHLSPTGTRRSNLRDLLKSIM